MFQTCYRIEVRKPGAIIELGGLAIHAVATVGTSDCAVIVVYIDSSDREKFEKLIEGQRAVVKYQGAPVIFKYQGAPAI